MTQTAQKKPTIASLALTYGLGEKTLDRWKADGVDIYDPEQVEIYRHLTQAPDCTQPGLAVEDAKELKRRKLEADTRHKEAQASIAELNLAKTQGALIDVGTVVEAQTEIAGKIKAQLKRLIIELPPKSEGLTAAQITPIVREQIENILLFLYEELKLEPEEEENT